jgi:hypothetical protein
MCSVAIPFDCASLAGISQEGSRAPAATAGANVEFPFLGAAQFTSIPLTPSCVGAVRQSDAQWHRHRILRGGSLGGQVYLEQMIDAFEPRLVDEDEVVIKQVRFDPNQTDVSTPRCVLTKPGMITRRSRDT